MFSLAGGRVEGDNKYMSKYIESLEGEKNFGSGVLLKGWVKICTGKAGKFLVFLYKIVSLQNCGCC